jgi:hypothetical protein
VDGKPLDPLGLAGDTWTDEDQAAYLHAHAADLKSRQARELAIRAVQRAQFENEISKKSAAGYLWEALKEQPGQSPEAQALRRWNNLGAEANAAVRNAWRYEDNRSLDPSLADSIPGL